MAFKLSTVFLMAVILLADCGSIEQERVTIRSIEKEVLLFSNDSNLKAEELYYDALLDLRTEFPDDLKNIKIIRQSPVWINNNPVKLRSYPALLMIENNKIVTKIEGTVPKQQIMKQLKHTLTAK
ncbi:MAG TPA: hypothetical protein VNM45_06920 [Bacillus sp. (in: firmicutes)]|nr:hypothetical protein [Bacillus sp. (in: firmicutes)]